MSERANACTTTPLASLCERIDYGVTASADFAVTVPKFLRITDIQENEVAWDQVPGCKADHRELNGCYLQHHDIVFARTGATTGKSFLVENPPDAVFASYLIRLRPRSEVCAEYLATFFLSEDYWHQISVGARGGIQPGFNASMLAALKVPVPPLAEQQQIAARVRKQLSAVETARRALEAQITAASRLPAALLESTFGAPDAEDWSRNRLGDVLIPRNDIVHPRDKPSGRMRFVGLEHVQSHTGRRLGAVEVEQSELTGRKARFIAGDIVYGYLRPYLNKVWIADFDGLCSVDQYVYRVDPKSADTSFIAWFLRSPTYLQRAPVDVSPGQLPRIRMNEVAAVEIGLPSLAEQAVIAARLDAELAAVATLRATLQARLNDLNKFPAALLRDAFGGDACSIDFEPVSL